MSQFVGTTESYRRGARTLEGSYYTSAEIFHEERELIDGKSWICVGRLRDLPAPGHYLTREIGGESVIVVRDREETLRALHNVCRHRGTRLCDAGAGRFRSTIQCPYHAWTYALDGSLVGAPHMEKVEGFDRNDYPLHSAMVEVWEGFVFVSLDPGAPPLAEAFAPIRDTFTRFALPDLRPVHREEYEVAANWKLITQNYSECLHCPTIHPELSAFIPYRSGANDLTEGPFLGGYMVIRSPYASATLSGRACGLPLGEGREEDRQRAYYYTIFPHMMLSIHPDYAVHYTLWPLGAKRTRIVCEWLFHPDSLRMPDFEPNDAVELWHLTNQQDWRISERSQLGVSSRVYRPGPYSPRESVPAAWDREYLRAMGRLE